mmetsp:Transcript_9491/g.36927  ORF Transcript_9491/g.36927 Transcript_9491/m.36927 type:complete len:251 (-) Transcript_9491:3699-4451(-)
MIPPRTMRSTLARPSMRRPSEGRMDSATSSSTKGTVVCSCLIIQPSERSCSGRRGYLVDQPGGCATCGSRRLDVSAKGGRASAASFSSCLTTCHSQSGADLAAGAAERSRAMPPVMLARALCTRVAGLTAMTRSPTASLLAPLPTSSLRHWTTKGAGLRLSACSYLAASWGFSLAMILGFLGFFVASSLPASISLDAWRTHWSLGGWGAQRGHEASQSSAQEPLAPLSRGTKVCTPSGSSSLLVNHASLE